jgi:hypothetical protein
VDGGHLLTCSGFVSCKTNGKSSSIPPLPPTLPLLEAWEVVVILVPPASAAVDDMVTTEQVYVDVDVGSVLVCVVSVDYAV